MRNFLSLGRWLFALPYGILGLFNLMNGEAMADVVPTYMPVKIVWVYLSGAGLVAATVSMLLGKYDRLATVLLAVFLLLMVFMLHLPGAISSTPAAQISLSMLLKDLSLAGAALMYALHYAKDRAVVG